MFVQRLYHDGLAQASYLIGCQATGEALVIDPNRAVEQYIAAAERAGLRITAVAETHIHADYMSGARQLAQQTGAQLYLSDMGPTEWKYAFAKDANALLLHDGNTFMVGNVRVESWHTPGHTPEHMSFLITDTKSATAPIAIASGDFVFVGDVGRPDLLERAAGVAGTMEAGARQLYGSLQRFRELPDYVQVWPGHGAGSACGKALGAIPTSTVGYERRFNWALGYENEMAFVNAVLDGQPAPPPYFAQMKHVNKIGPALRPTALPDQLSIEQIVVNDELFVLDVRPADDFAAGHLPGAINIPFGGSFLNWAGWFVPYDRPIALVAAEAQLHAVRDELLLIGLDDVAGYATPAALGEWAASNHTLPSFRRVAAGQARAIVAQNGAVLLDVRNPDEYAGGHIPGSRNIPVGQLPKHLDALPCDKRVVVHCAGGSRSPIAASLLHAHGVQDIVEIADGFNGWRAAGGDIET